MAKAVYAFCDGWAQEDRAHMFSLIGKDELAMVFVCSCGKGKCDWFPTPDFVLKALNEAAAHGQKPLFKIHSQLPIHMYSSSGGKTLHVFTRL